MKSDLKLNFTSEAWSHKPGSHMPKDEGRDELPTLAMSDKNAESAGSNPAPAPGAGGTPSSKLPPGTTSGAVAVKDVQSPVAGTWN